MKRWVRWVAALYPARWRKRYGAEFDALIEDANPRWKDFFDILRGALEMQMASRSIVTTAALAGALGAIVAAGIAWWIPERFVSTAVVRPAPAAQAAEVDEMALRPDALSRSALVPIIEKNGMYLPREAGIRWKMLWSSCGRTSRCSTFAAPRAATPSWCNLPIAIPRRQEQQPGTWWRIWSPLRRTFDATRPG
jgi:hypothetical protein